MNLWGARLCNRLIRLRTGGRRLSPAAQDNLRALDRLAARLPVLDLGYCVVDLETTGLDHTHDRMVSVGGFRVRGGRVMLGDFFDELVNPGRDIPPESIKVHGVTPGMIAASRPAAAVMDDFLVWLGDDILVAHHALFDLQFINRVLRASHGFRLQNLVTDTVLMCRTVLIEPDPYGIRRGAKRCSLDYLTEAFNIELPERHTALGDALATSLLLLRLLQIMTEKGWSTLGDLVKVAGVW